jgi:hypothetical protein
LVGRIAQRIPSEQLEQNRAHRVDVTASVKGGAARLFRRHIGQVSLERRNLRVIGAPLGRAKVGQFHLAGIGQKHVVRRDISMDEAGGLAIRSAQLMREMHALAQLAHDVQGNRIVQALGQAIRAG